jgi:acetyl esterase/lipase
MTNTITIPAEREGREAPADLAERRGQMAAALAAGMLPGPVGPVQEETIAGRRALRLSPAGGNPRATLVMFHGGGYRLGAPENDARFGERLAERCGIEVIIPTYRLAPENPFPAGFNDALGVLEEVARTSGSAPLIVGGDSAGGGLAAALAVYAGANGGPKIDGALLLSPWVDMTITAASFKENVETDLLFPESSAAMASETYMQGFDLKHPIASPLFGDVSTFPNTFINVGTGETLRDDAVSLHEKLQAAGVPSRLLLVPGMEHVAVVRSTELTGSLESFEAIVEYLEAVIAG